MVTIEDNIHCDMHGEYETFEDAIAELRIRATIPWDQRPNLAPCTSWKTCGREYSVIEYNTSQMPWQLLRTVPVLNVSANAVEWMTGFEAAWSASTPP